MSDLADARPATAPDTLLSTETIARVAVVASVTIWLGVFLFTGMPQLTLEVFPRTVTLHAMAGGLAIVYVGYLALTRRLPGGTPLDLPVLGLIGAYVIATSYSINFRASVEATLQFAVPVIAFYALAGLPYLSASRLRYIFVGLGAGLSFYALWIVGNDYADHLSFIRSVEGLNSGNIFPPTVPRVHSVSDHPNILAMVLVLAVPFFAIMGWHAANWWERALAAIALLATAMTLFLTLSRGAWIGASVALVFTVVAAWITAGAHRREAQGEQFSWRTLVPDNVSPTGIATIVSAGVLAVGGGLAFLAGAGTRPGWLFRGSLSPREDAWRSGLDMFRDYPLTGSGPNTFGLLYPEYSGRFLVHTQHAHNGFLQAANDLGIIGLFALAAIAGAVVFMLWRTWREGLLEQRLMAVACAGALIGFSLHNQLDAGNTWKAPGIALALVGAIIARNYLERPAAIRPVTSAEPWRRYALLAPRALLLVLLIPLFAVVYRVDTAHYDYWRGVDGFFAPNVPAAHADIAAVQEAVNRDSGMMIYQMQLGLMQAAVYRETGEQALLDRAIIHFERAVELDERSALAHANLARAYQMAGRDDEAAEQAAATRFISRHHVPPVLMVAEVYEDMDREEDAIAAYGQVLSMDAGLADSDFWQGTEFRRDHFDDFLQASALGINACTFGSYLVTAHRSDPESSLDRLPETSEACQILVFVSPNDLVRRTHYARILMEEGRMDEAYEHLDFATSRQPDFGPARTELGIWYERQGDIEAARAQWVLGGQLDEPESLRRLGQTYPPGEVPIEVIDRLRELLDERGSSIQNDIISILYYRMRYARMSADPLIAGEWQTAVPRSYARSVAAVEAWEAGEPAPEPGASSRP